MYVIRTISVRNSWKYVMVFHVLIDQLLFISSGCRLKWQRFRRWHQETTVKRNRSLPFQSVITYCIWPHSHPTHLRSHFFHHKMHSMGRIHRSHKIENLGHRLRERRCAHVQNWPGMDNQQTVGKRYDSLCYLFSLSEIIQNVTGGDQRYPPRRLNC